MSETSISLIPAEACHASLTFPWRNDASSRSRFHDTRELTIAGHETWWFAAIAATDRHLFLALEGRQPIGVLRLDQAGTSAEVSIYLDPTKIGRRLGSRVLDAGAVHAAGLGIEVLTASIKDDNIASQRAFEAAGFQRSGGCWIRKLVH